MHRLGEWLFALEGVIGIITSFIPGVREWDVVGALLVVALMNVIYSFNFYQRLEDREGEEPLSSPFDEPKEYK